MPQGKHNTTFGKYCVEYLSISGKHIKFLWVFESPDKFLLPSQLQWTLRGYFRGHFPRKQKADLMGYFRFRLRGTDKV